MGIHKDKLSGMFEQIAANHGVSADEVVRDIQFAIDDAWNDPSPAARQKQREMFPNGKPSIEEFISESIKWIEQQEQ